MSQIEQQLERLPLESEEVFGSLVETESNYLPVRIGDDGKSLIDYRTAGNLTATPQAVIEITKELINEESDDNDRNKRILRGARYVLDLLTEGGDSEVEETSALTSFTSLDVANMLELFRDQNPSTVSLNQLLDEGISVNGIEIIYSASEQLRLSHAEVRSLAKFNVNISDPDDLGLIDDAIDVILKKHKINSNFRGTGLKLLTGELESGKFLSDILDESF